MAKGKSNSASSSTTAQSKKNTRKATKTSKNQQKLIDISSEDGSSISDVKNSGKNAPVRQAASNGSLNKRSRIANNKDIDENFATSPSSPSAASFTSAISSIVTKKTAPSEAIPQKSADLSIPNEESQPHFPVAKEGNNDSSMNLDSAAASLDPTEHAILPESSVNTSHHIYHE